MNLDTILSLSDLELTQTLNDQKEYLFKLYNRLDISLLRVGIMALSIHDNHCTLSEVFDIDDLLFRITSASSVLNSLQVEFDQRKNRMKV